MAAPLWEALLRHISGRPRPWHVPGHKMGRGAPPELIRWMGPGLRLDLTELPGLDDLHEPEGAIAEAQALAAQAAGADETFFLVGGSTAGNLAMLLAACRPGETVLIARNAHKSVIHGLALAGAEAVAVAPEWDGEVGVACGVSVEAVCRMLEAHPGVRTVLVTSPTYHGVCSDLAAIAEVVHRRGGLLLVDEAHGAHFPFVPGSPPTALSCGADAAVQSWHKTAGSLTQSAMLHVRGERLDRDRLRQALTMIQSSSPSYLLMASLDLAREWMTGEGGTRLVEAATELAKLRLDLAGVPILAVLSEDRVRRAAAPFLDGTRLTVGVAPSGRTGSQWEEALRRRGVWAELVEPTAVTLVAGPGDDGRSVGRLAEVLWDVVREMGEDRERGEAHQWVGRQKEAMEWLVLLQRLWEETAGGEPIRPFLWNAPVRWVPAEQAVGRISARAVIPYPPGIPLLLPGERVRPLHVELLKLGRDLSVRFQGLKADGDRMLAVVEEVAG
ncbi:MAG: aminotransferase class I/II-fold pyridoxal phosphate-dependent enzyme [Alicyclobacillaceae bacterium]|nr:aminotransferase class I/II-fold pyridoxal phosphate-dependent enzyme [Alicyclobacillaceae bacterium]